MIKDIWSSLVALPKGVIVWVFVILVPINMASAVFIGVKGGLLVATLACMGILPNAGVMAYDRGFSKLMALSHLIFWPPLIVVIVTLLSRSPTDIFQSYLIALLVVNVVSLAFDVIDFCKWWNGDRSAA